MVNIKFIQAAESLKNFIPTLLARSTKALSKVESEIDFVDSFVRQGSDLRSLGSVLGSNQSSRNSALNTLSIDTETEEESFAFRSEVLGPLNRWILVLEKEVVVESEDVDVDVLAIEYINGSLGSRLGIPSRIYNGSSLKEIIVEFQEPKDYIGYITLYKTNLNRVINFYESLRSVLEALDNSTKLDLEFIQTPSREWRTSITGDAVIAINSKGLFLDPTSISKTSNSTVLTFNKEETGIVIATSNNKFVQLSKDLTQFLSNFLNIVSIIIPVFEIIEKVKATTATVVPLNPSAGAIIADASTRISQGKSTAVKIEYAVTTLIAIAYMIRESDTVINQKRLSLLGKIDNKLRKVKAERRKLELSL